MKNRNLFALALLAPLFFAPLFFMAPLSAFAASGPNLIANPSVETGTSGNPTSWVKTVTSQNRVTYTYPVTGFNSTKALQVSVSRNNGSTDAWYFTEVPVIPGHSYTYTDSYKDSGASYLSARYHLSNGTYSYSPIVTVSSASNWKTSTITIVPPANTSTVTVLHYINSGTLTTDNFSLTENLSATTTPPVPPVQKPVISSFSANPTLITSGQSSTLSWSVASATMLSIDQGVGIVTGTSKIVSPTATTTYTLSASNSAGTTTATAVVNVALPVIIIPPPATSTPTTTPPVLGPNLIQNGDFELGTTNNPTNWNADDWGSLTAKFTYPVPGKNGGKAAQVQITKYTDGDAKWDFNHITVSSHTIYQFSEDYISNVTTNVTIEYLMSDGTYDYEWVHDVPASATWSNFTAQITVPTGAVSFTVLNALTGVGSLTVDNASLVALPASPFTQGIVTFSFDDGLLSQYQNALPIMNAAAFKGTFFIITSEPTSGDSGYMNWTQIKALGTAGEEIAGHTRTHPYLTTLNASQLQSEVTGSYTDLVAQGFTPKTFAYPYGDLNPTVEAAVKAAGYLAARGSYFGINGPFADHYDFYDIRLDSTSNLATIEKYIDQAAADKRWVVFEIHDVLASGGDTYSITPAFLQSVVNYVKSKGVSVFPMSQGIGLLNP